MDTKKICSEAGREAFETHWVRDVPREYRQSALVEMKANRTAEGGYERDEIRWAWEAWQAASGAAVQEPVAWKVDGLNGYNESAPGVWLNKGNAEESAAMLFKASVTPLYAAPQAAVTVALTDEHIVEIGKRHFREGHNPDAVKNFVAACRDVLAALMPASEPVLDADFLCVGSFAEAMKQKLLTARAKGRSGWQDCDPADLSRMLREHVEKGDPRDVANFCMMLWHLEAPIAAPVPRQAEAGLTDEQFDALFALSKQHAMKEVFRRKARALLAASTPATTAGAAITKEWCLKMARLEPDKGVPSEGASDECDVPPNGWRCSREKGHTGPCAASPAADSQGAFCSICKGYGRYHDGDSRTESDGYAPNIVECECTDEERLPQYRAASSATPSTSAGEES